MSQRPNILLITSDQQHYDTIGLTNPRIKTPALDRLCNEGTRFSRAYCPNPTCTPTRASIITGMYPSLHGAWSLGTKLDENVPTVGDLLRQQGYATSLIGKAHFQPLASAPDQTSIECMPLLRDLDFWRDFHGPWYGFDHVEITRNHADEFMAGAHYGIWLEEQGVQDWQKYFREWPLNPNENKRKHKWDLPQELHYTTWTAERTIANIEKQNEEGKPFFTWASFHDPHPAYLVPEPWDTMYDPAEMKIESRQPYDFENMPPHYALTQQEKPDFSEYQETPFSNHGFSSHLVSEERLRKDLTVYYGMTSFMDQQIGRILDKLDELGIAENTIVVFSTDHGHLMGHHGLTAKGAFPYEDLIRLPFIVRWPGKTPPGSNSSALQSLVDLAPTFLKAAEGEIPGWMQGVDQSDVWSGQKAAARDSAICEFRHQPTKVHLRTYIENRYKITIYRDQTYGELFDLETDPGEMHNRWDDPDYAEIKSRLMQRFLNAELQREPMRYPRISGA
jgi:arylsulfatase A-like enzyme